MKTTFAVETRVNGKRTYKAFGRNLEKAEKYMDSLIAKGECDSIMITSEIGGFGWHGFDTVAYWKKGETK